MKKQYFLKDKKAQIYKEVSQGKDEDGFSLPDKYYPIAPAPIWCYTSQLSQKDIVIAKAYDQTETRYFVFNNHKGIAIYDMISYRNVWYRITRVDTQDDYNGDIFVYVENAKGGWIPKDSDIAPYTPGIWEQ